MYICTYLNKHTPCRQNRHCLSSIVMKNIILYTVHYALYMYHLQQKCFNRLWPSCMGMSHYVKNTFREIAFKSILSKLKPLVL